MPKAKLDAAFAAAARCVEGRTKTDFYDTDVTGFMLEVRKSGGRTFFLRYTNAAGRLATVKLAVHGDAPFAQIKKKAERLRAEVALGGDPLKEKADAKAVPVYNALAIQHMADAELHCRSYPTIRGYMEKHIVPRWGLTRLTDIDGRAVAHWLAAKRADGLAPATVEKIRMIFSRSFELGRRWGIAGCDKNPARAVPRKPLNNARERFLTAEEAVRLREAAYASRNPQLGFIVDTLLLSGLRLNECLQAQWQHVDFDRRSWLIPKTKTGKARHIPLTTPLLDLLTKLPRFEGCPWLVPNLETLKPFVTIKHGWQAARDAAGLPGLRLHDLRHAYASFVIAGDGKGGGVDIYTLGKLLGHASFQSTQRYAHLAHDTLLAAAEAGARNQQTN